MKCPKCKFIGYMVDHCDGERITEEFLKQTYSDFLKAGMKPLHLPTCATRSFSGRPNKCDCGLEP